MVRIKCVNPACSGPKKSFEWDESQQLKSGGRMATPHESGAVSLLVTCSHCGTGNKVWVMKVKKNVGFARK